MPRGGRRQGAGRKPVVGPLERLAIGIACELLWREAVMAARQAAIAKATSNVREDWAKAQDVPVSERPEWHKIYEGQNHTDNVEIAFRIDHGIAPEAPEDTSIPRRFRRLATIPYTRPWGHRERIINLVATEEARKRGIAIRPRLVRDCWNEYRANEKRAKKDLDS